MANTQTGASKKTYTTNTDGSITVNRTDGSSSTVSPGTSSYNNTVSAMKADGVSAPGSSSSSSGGTLSTTSSNLSKGRS